MTETNYIFNNKRITPEKDRLKMLESVHDDRSRHLLSTVGLKPGAWALEIGFGAGSMLNWLAEQVGPKGHVTGVDLTTEFVDPKGKNISIKKGDIQTFPLSPLTYDVIHARYVFIHIPKAKDVLKKCFAALRPGGWLVVEDPEFTSCKPIQGTSAQKTSFNNITQAILHMYHRKKLDGAFGLKLKPLFTELSLKNISEQVTEHRVFGGSPMAQLMGRSAQQLKKEYIDTHLAAPGDIDTYIQMANDVTTQAVYYSTVAVMGQKEG